MAAGILSKPGTQYGPCEAECQHVDCQGTREMAAAPCLICKKPIGYDTRFYVGQIKNKTYYHATCLEERDGDGT
jgi:hypothetical protein